MNLQYTMVLNEYTRIYSMWNPKILLKKNQCNYDKTKVHFQKKYHTTFFFVSANNIASLHGKSVSLKADMSLSSKADISLQFIIYAAQAFS